MTLSLKEDVYTIDNPSFYLQRTSQNALRYAIFYQMSTLSQFMMFLLWTIDVDFLQVVVRGDRTNFNEKTWS